jgi:menaquinone-9 beta-reductase
MQHSDVLIIGGGPAGSTCAWALRRAGMDVAVLDQAQFPRNKVCAGWITPAVLESLQIDVADYARDQGIQPIRGFRVGLMNAAGDVGKALSFRYHATVSYGIRRFEFDDYLLRRSGARLLSGEPARSPRREGREWRINDFYGAPMLVGAGGHACPVARMLGALPAKEPAVLAKEIEFLLPEAARQSCKVHGQRPELYFCRDLAGYGWCMRKGDYLNIGLGRENRWDLAKHVEGFVAYLRRERGVPQPPGHFNGHAYLLHGRVQRNLLDDGVLLIGDAAGLASPHSGEGIRAAVESGLLAAQTIIAARGDYSRQALLPYLDRLHDRFGQGNAMSYAVPTWARVLLARALFGLPALVRQVVLDRYFLHAGQAALEPPQAA